MTHVISLCQARAAAAQTRQVEADSSPDWVDLARSGAAERLFDALAGAPVCPPCATPPHRPRPAIRLAIRLAG